MRPAQIHSFNWSVPEICTNSSNRLWYCFTNSIVILWLTMIDIIPKIKRMCIIWVLLDAFCAPSVNGFFSKQWPTLWKRRGLCHQKNWRLQKKNKVVNLFNRQKINVRNLISSVIIILFENFIDHSRVRLAVTYNEW